MLKDSSRPETRDRPLSVWEKGIAIVPIPLFLFALLANGYIGFFSRYVMDDYCTAGSLVSKGFIGSQQYWYLAWTGRYSFTFAINLAELIGPVIVPILPLFTIAIWLAVAFWTVLQLRKLTGLESPLVITVLFSTMIVFGAIDVAPSIEQTLFWQTGMLTYIAPLIVLTFVIGLISNRLTRKTQTISVSFLIIPTLLTFIAGGFSETYVVLQTTAFGLAAVLCVSVVPQPTRRTVFPIFIAALVGSILAMVIIILAPGNAIRQYSFPKTPGALSILQSSIFYASLFLQKYILGRMMAVLFLLSLLFAFVLPTEQIRINNRRRFFNLLIAMILIPVLGFILIVSCFVPSFYGMSVSLPPRALEIPLFVLLLVVIIEGYLVGVLAKQSKYAGGIGKSPRRFLLAAPILMFLLFLGPITFSNRTLAKEPVMRDFAESWEKQDLEIRAAKQEGLSDLTVAAINNPFELVDIGPDPNKNLNRCASSYYGVKSIITVTK